MNTDTIYLDNAATTFPKPPSVCREVSLCIRTYCGNAGRGSHALAMASAMKIFECREKLADFLGLAAPENILFTLNTTYAINLLLKGLLKKGDHVLISDLEHNAVLRPIRKLADEGRITYDIFPSRVSEAISPAHLCAGIDRLRKPNTKLLFCTHASNVCSYHFPIATIGDYCHKHGIFFAVDAAQSAGHLPIDMEAMHIDALCAPGHKGLFGIQGCGFLALGNSYPLDTLVEGGNGLYSLEAVMSDDMPERFEAGTLPTPAIASLLRGVEWLSSVGQETVASHEARLFESLGHRLADTKGFTVYAPRHRGGVLLFNMDGIPSEAVASALGEQGFCLRGGFHCSALGHRTLNTGENGAVRASFSAFNSLRDVDRLYSALLDIKKGGL